MEIKIKERKLDPLTPLPDLSSGICNRAPGHVSLDSLSALAHFRCRRRNQLGTPARMRWIEGNLNGIFINFINTSTKQKRDSFIDLNIKITCAFFAFSQR